jgi:hypothetical protein
VALVNFFITVLKMDAQNGPAQRNCIYGIRIGLKETTAIFQGVTRNAYKSLSTGACPIIRTEDNDNKKR